MRTVIQDRWYPQWWLQMIITVMINPGWWLAGINLWIYLWQIMCGFDSEQERYCYERSSSLNLIIKRNQVLPSNTSTVFLWYWLGKASKKMTIKNSVSGASPTQEKKKRLLHSESNPSRLGKVIRFSLGQTGRGKTALPFFLIFSVPPYV